MQPGSSPLDQLADIHLPDSVSWWPLAPGWWILLGLLVFIVVMVILWRKHQRAGRYRKAAVELLQAAWNEYQTHRQTSIYLQQLSEILRRVARTTYGSLFNASIKGDAWLQWLDQSCPALKAGFASGPGRILLSGPYQKNPHAELEPLHQLSLEWIRQHSSKRLLLKQRRKKTADNAEVQHV
jgi:hypothetical protein